MTREPVLCRAPTVQDVPALASLHVAAWQAGYRGLMPDGFLNGLSADEPGWAAAVAETTPSILVAEDRGEVLGACRFGASSDADAPPSTGEIYSLNLHPSAWGRGLGRGLLAAATARLGQLGLSRVTLWVLPGNIRARALYERFGFVADGSERRTSDLIGFPLDEVRYNLHLQGK
jgi:RimJ/RimL family protein N-acetyltransferase